MKTWKLVSGIISILVFTLMSFQSCAVGCAFALAESETGTQSGMIGLIASCLILAAGIVSIATMNKKNGNVAIIVLNVIALLFSFSQANTYKDLYIYGTWALACAIVATVFVIKSGNNKTSQTNSPVQTSPTEPIVRYNVIDNSMEPDILKDSLIQVKLTKTIENGKTYLFVYKDKKLIRRVYYNPNGAVLEPANKSFNTINVNKEEFEKIDIIGQVL